jgi:hypothetical protein
MAGWNTLPLGIDEWTAIAAAADQEESFSDH